MSMEKEATLTIPLCQKVDLIKAVPKTPSAEDLLAHFERAEINKPDSRQGSLTLTLERHRPIYLLYHKKVAVQDETP